MLKNAPVLFNVWNISGPKFIKKISQSQFPVMKNAPTKIRKKNIRRPIELVTNLCYIYLKS